VSAQTADEKAAVDELIQLYDALAADPTTPPSVLNKLAETINKSLDVVDPGSMI
jgi:hypothetical protein